MIGGIFIKKYFSCLMAVLITVLCFSGCQQNSDMSQAEQTSSEVQQESDAAEQTVETSETSETTLSETETEIPEEADDEEIADEDEEENEETDIAYELDPNTVFTKDFFDNDSYINQPMFVSSPEGSEANVYVMLADESKQWECYDYMFSESYYTTQYVIIEHDGVADKIPCRWAERFQDPFTVYSGDYDGDGEKEIASARYSTGGTLCCIYELSIFKIIDGHYQCFTIDNMDILDEYVSYEIDNENHRIEFTIKDAESSFIMDTSEYFDGEVKGVRYGDAVRYFVDGDDITMNSYLFLKVSDLVMPFSDLMLNMKVHFSDGEFTCSDPVFEFYE